jgi:ribokinase
MPLSPKPVVVVGSINIDLVASAERIPLPGETVRGSNFEVHPGGKGANQAVAVARLGYPVQLIGKVGTDVFGGQLLTYLKGTGVDVQAVERHDGASGVATITVSPRGENSIVVVPGANAQVTPAFLDQHRETIRSAGIVLAQLEIPVETVMYLATLCAEDTVPLVLDPAPAQTLPAEIFQHVCWFTPNETEADFFFSGEPAGRASVRKPEQVASTLLNLGVQGVVLKKGSSGAYLASPEDDVELPAFPVKVVDTTAAGDAFNGAFAMALMLGLKPVAAARFASAAAAVSVTRPGAQPSMPSKTEVDELLKTCS